MLLMFFACLGIGEKETDPEPSSETENEPASDGCGIAQQAGVADNFTFNAGDLGGGERGYFLVVPETYDPNIPSRLIFGFAGTDWVGEQIRPYLGLEEYGEPNDIFVYPDPLWRDFEGWGTYGGWVLGPYADPAHGNEDILFVEALIDDLKQNYCIASEQIYATGHSWGGDMAQIVSCFLGHRFRATVPVASNRPYWFEPPEDVQLSCTGKTAVWTMFGINETHFTWQSYDGEYGDECRDFWLEENGCNGSDDYVDLGLGSNAECVEFNGCEERTLYCLYGAEHGHQIPSNYYSEQTMSFFHSFE